VLLSCLLLLVVVALTGCVTPSGGTTGVPPATQSTMVYDQALTAYLNAWDSYHMVWVALPANDPRKTEWTKVYHPKFLAAAIALESWSRNPGSAPDAVAANAAIDQVTAVLIQLAIPLKKGGN
jgi:hypothetical protein